MSSDAGAARKTPKLRRRDYILVPLIALATTIVLFGAAEVGTRVIWPAHIDDDTCVIKDKFEMVRAQPNCTVKTKIAEGPWVSYDFNSCGYRSFAACGPKPAGTLRIVFLGSSITQGFHVPYEDTFAERTVRALQKATGRKIENENLGFEGLSPLLCYRKVSEALALKPDLVVYTVSPFDLEEKMDPAQLADRNKPKVVFTRAPVTFEISPIKRLQVALNDSRAFMMAQHFLFSNTDTYLRLSMARGDKTDYLRVPLSAPWKDRFSDFNILVIDMASRLRKAGVPLLIMVVPSHQEAALMSTDRPPPKTDPLAFGNIIREMAVTAGAGYVDALGAFGHVAHSDRLFFLFESHLNGDGNALVSRALVEKCLDGSIPAFSKGPTFVAPAAK